jgi:Tfp pilus assembly protein PilW
MNHLKVGRGRMAFTLIEALIGALISGLLLAALAAGSIALIKSYNASEDYSNAQTDQLRVLDYISRDVRRALTVAVTANPPKLTLTVPDQYAAANPDRTFRAPTMTNQGPVLTATYGTAPVTVSYYVANSNFVRDENGVVNIIAQAVSDFQPVFDDTDPAGKTVKTTLTFVPIFRRTVSNDARIATTLTSRAVMRNP